MSEHTYTYQRTYPNGKTYTNKTKYTPTGKPRGRPKLSDEEKLRREMEKLKIEIEKLNMKKDLAIVPAIETPIIQTI